MEYTSEKRPLCHNNRQQLETRMGKHEQLLQKILTPGQQNQHRNKQAHIQEVLKSYLHVHDNKNKTLKKILEIRKHGSPPELLQLEPKEHETASTLMLKLTNEQLIPNQYENSHIHAPHATKNSQPRGGENSTKKSHQHATYSLKPKNTFQPCVAMKGATYYSTSKKHLEITSYIIAILEIQWKTEPASIQRPHTSE